MNDTQTWDPRTDWKPTKIDWVKVDISPADLRRFNTRSNLKGLCHTVGFLSLLALSGGLSYYAFSTGRWILLALALYVHGAFYAMITSGIHELIHNTVFANKALNTAVTALFGWLYWPLNPHLYRLSHLTYHHRYTLYQGSDGEDVPKYVHMSPWVIISMLFKVIHLKDFLRSVVRLFTLTPLWIWRETDHRLDSWEQFILREANPKDLKRIRRMGIACLVGHTLFAATSLYFGFWFLPVLITLAPFYGSRFMLITAGIAQHAGCDANNPDFRLSCRDVKLDPLTSFMHWRMEYHIEHHMFAGIPCYNLKAFRTFIEDQLPPREFYLPNLRTLNKLSKEKFGDMKSWKQNFGIYTGI